MLDLNVAVERAIMKRIFAGLGVAAVLLFGASLAQGCGDKNVSINSGILNQRAYVAWKKASVVIFSNPRASGAALTKRNLRAAMKEAGHSVVFVQDSNQLAQVLEGGRVDILLIDLADAGTVAHELDSASTKPTVVPVLYKPSKSDFAAAQRQNPFALKASDNEIQFLKTIDAAMNLRQKS
jgi:hypothetical protein